MADEDAKKADQKEQPIIIKKIVKGGGHHGGAWKVAYADFVTAMMAFFLLLWLLNVSTDEQLEAISNYFDPTHPKVSESTSGAGGVMGGLSMAPQGSMATNVQPITAPRPTGSNANPMSQKKSAEDAKKEQAKGALKQEEEERFEQAQDAIRQAIQADPELAELSKNLMVDMTPEGLRIQIVDQEGEPMFASGSAQMFEKTRRLMGKLAGIIRELPNELSVRGHTDSVPYGAGADYTNWELSSDRAHSSRRALLESGFPPDRLDNVVGKADTEPLITDNPSDPRNRRISIILLKEELTNPDYEKKVEERASEMPDPPAGDSGAADSGNATPQVPIGTFRRTPGNVEFP